MAAPLKAKHGLPRSASRSARARPHACPPARTPARTRPRLPAPACVRVYKGVGHSIIYKGVGQLTVGGFTVFAAGVLTA